MAYYHDALAIIVASSDRAGSASVAKHLSGQEMDQSMAVLDPRPVCLILRNPIERFQSCFARSQEDGEFPDGEDHNLKSFTDKVLSGWQHPAWMPQCDQHVFKMKLGQEHVLFATVVQLETLPDHWPKENVAEYPKPWINYRVQDLYDFYARDWAAWMACEDYRDVFH